MYRRGCLRGQSCLQLKVDNSSSHCSVLSDHGPEMTAMVQENRESDISLAIWCLCKNNSILGVFQSIQNQNIVVNYFLGFQALL